KSSGYSKSCLKEKIKNHAPHSTSHCDVTSHINYSAFNASQQCSISEALLKSKNTLEKFPGCKIDLTECPVINDMIPTNSIRPGIQKHTTKQKLLPLGAI
ncbi:MAG: hypothetical protein PHY48_15510, partial [Candidatus Cloacimonetes bacterium]|nr:hypothetical protein [Candidatus Cloacimonadota bacterium]